MTTQDNPPVEVTQALGFGTEDDASVNLQGVVDDLQGLFNPNDGGVCVQTINRVIDQIETVRRLASQRPVVGDEVERVARTIHEARMAEADPQDAFDWGEANKEYYRRIAKAAIAAMQPQAPATAQEAIDRLVEREMEAAKPEIDAAVNDMVNGPRGIGIMQGGKRVDPAEFFAEPPATGDVGELVARLRAVDHMNVEECFLDSYLFEKAAAKLTELQAEVERLKMTAPALSAPPNAS